jgi:hypothetical protein
VVSVPRTTKPADLCLDQPTVAMGQAPAPIDDLRRFPPLAQKLARMLDGDELRFRQRLREEPTMGNLREPKA